MGANTSNERLNIYIIGGSEDFWAWHKNSDYYNLINSGNTIDEEVFKRLTSDIKRQIQNKQQYNCILIFLDNYNYTEKLHMIYASLSNVYRPIVILAFNNEIKNEKNISDRIKYFEIAFYTKDNYTEIDKKIKSVYNYYFNIGDNGLINFIQILNNFTFKNKKNGKKENEGIIKSYKATLNILVIGRTGCGKSTLINLLLNQNRAREGIGYSMTKFYSQYVHEKYPITFTDTIGFEDSESLEKMEKFLHSCSEFFNEGKSKYHLILYLINAGNERTPTKKELDLIYYISNDLNLPIFFICTHSKTEEASQEFKEEVKISLIQYFSKKNKGETSKTNNPNSKEKTEVSDPGPGENTGTNNLNPKDKTETDNTNPKENTETNNPGSEEKTETNNPSSGEKTETNNPNSKEKIEINSLNHKENTETNNPNLKEKIYPILEKETESIDRILEEKTRIYCCHLVNEKDRKYTRFGIEKILDGIKDLFSPQIEKIKNFEKDFIKNSTEEININKNFKPNKNTENETAEQPLNILRSLEKSNSFVEYLKKLSMNICNKYDKKIYEIEKNKFNLDLKIETLENILKGLKEHLAFELDIDPSKFDVSSNSQANHSSISNNQSQYSILGYFSKLGGGEKKQDKIDSLQSKIEKIKEIINSELEKNKDNINPYMREVIHNYEEAIDSLEEIKKFIIKREF